MKFIFLGHACFQIDTGKEKLLFDPFLTGNGLAEELSLIHISEPTDRTRSRMPSSA